MGETSSSGLTPEQQARLRALAEQLTPLADIEDDDDRMRCFYCGMRDHAENFPRERCCGCDERCCHICLDEHECEPDAEGDHD